MTNDVQRRNRRLGIRVLVLMMLLAGLALAFAIKSTPQRRQVDKEMPIRHENP